MFCLVLGFFVAMIRPRDPLGVAAAGAHAELRADEHERHRRNEPSAEWPDGLRSAALFYSDFFAGTWQIWILLFGIYFPTGCHWIAVAMVKWV